MSRKDGRNRLRVAAVAAALALGIATPTLAWAGPGQSDGRYEAGDPGVGDPYFPLYGNGGYQVRHYLLDVTYTPESNHLDGVATLRATATNDLFRFNLDLTGLTVHEITVGGEPAQWDRTDDHELIITPKHKLKAGENFEVVVRYSGVPVTFTLPGFDIPAGFNHTDDGATVAGQPLVATAWYPVNDHPLDKATYTFDVTVPKGLEAIGNGRLLAHYTVGDWTTWRWIATEPMASYLATATIGQFETRQYRTPEGLPVFDAIDPDLRTVADNAISRQVEVLDFLESQFGPYPFHALGAIVDDTDDLYFALENQTRPVYSKYFFEPGKHPEEVYVVVHELAHQWYGDSVALYYWKHIWLNEGFATYAEWLWSDHTGEESPQQIFDTLYANNPEGDAFWDVKTGNPGQQNLFDSEAVYTRGAMTLHALRMTVGDEAFFEILRSWHEQQAGGNGKTAEFIALAEDVSGQQLDGLFQQWLFEAEKPPYPGPRAAPATTQSQAETPQVIKSLRERLQREQRF